MKSDNRGGPSAVPAVHGGTKVVGVFGWPVEHSLSPAMHNAAFAALGLPYVYVPFAVAPEQIGAAVRGLLPLGVVGVNLTIPHKEGVLPFLDELTPEAQRVGAVNTVHALDGRLLGDNTDGRGFWEPLREAGVSLAGRTAVILGAGGAARSVAFRLVAEGVKVALINRTRERADRLARDVAERSGPPDVSVTVVDAADAAQVTRTLRESSLLVQTTKVGMHPNEGERPTVPPDALRPELLVYDLVYNPIETALLREARSRGCRTLNGVKMLVCQGAAAFERWTGVWPPTGVMEAAVLAGLNAPRPGAG